MTKKTPFKNKSLILADLWLNYRDDENLKDFIAYNDLGLPLAYAVANKITGANKQVRGFIEESFNLLLAGLEIEDQCFELVDDVFLAAETNELDDVEED